MRIVSRLAVLLRDRGLTIKQLSKRTGVSRETIGRIAKNTFTRLRGDIIEKLCAELGITSLDELFEVYAANIFFPIRLHKEVTLHVGSDLVTEQGRAGVRIGAWDFRAMREVHEYLNRTVPGIKVHVEEHVRYDPAVAEKAKRTLEQGNHLIFGSSVANDFAEVVVCQVYAVPAYSPEPRTEFPFVFNWGTDRPVQSSFGSRVGARKLGIVSTTTGAVFASHTQVASGQGEDGALIMTYRVWRPPVRRKYGRHDENIIIAILGYSGIGTYGGALVATDPASSRALYPGRAGSPLMRVASVSYTRPPSPSLHDNRQVATARLVSEDDGNYLADAFV